MFVMCYHCYFLWYKYFYFAHMLLKAVNQNFMPHSSSFIIMFNMCTVTMHSWAVNVWVWSTVCVCLLIAEKELYTVQQLSTYEWSFQESSKIQTWTFTVLVKFQLLYLQPCAVLSCLYLQCQSHTVHRCRKLFSARGTEHFRSPS